MINKQRTSSPKYPELVDKETELADLEKIMDSFDAEDEKIIGTIVKLDCDGSQGISDSPPQITLNEAVTPANVVDHDGVELDTNGSKTTLEGVTSRLVSENDSLSLQDAEAAPPKGTVMEGGTVKQRKSHNLHLVTPVNAALKGVTQKFPALQSTEGVTSNTVGNSKNSDQLTPANAALEGVTPKTPLVQLSNASETASLGTDVTPENDTYKENQTNLLDLVINQNECAQPVLLASNQAVDAAVMPANVGEFDFPALSSEEDNGCKAPTHSQTTGFEQMEMQLTEEEDDAVSALVSLSKSMSSDNSQEDLDNSELLPIGKTTVDTAPVPICLGADDVNREIKKLKIPSVTKGNDTLSDQKQDTEITTTIIANRDGSVVSAVSEHKRTPKPLSLPNSPKTTKTPPDDSPGSPQGNSS